MEFSVRPIRACLLQGTVSIGNQPPWGGADGEGGGGYGSPLSCLDVSLKTSLAGSPPTSRPLRGLLPPPQGGGQCVAIVRIAVHWEHETDLWQGVHVDGGEVVSSRAVYRWRIAPVGEGLAGRGEAETVPPAPVSTCH